MSRPLINPTNNNTSILEKIYLRERTISRNPLYVTNDLSSNIAWNIPRLQNMILAVGPATPACIMYNRHSLSSGDNEGEGADSSSSSESSSQDDDDEDEDSTTSITFQNVADMSSGDDNEENEGNEEEKDSSEEEQHRGVDTEHGTIEGQPPQSTSSSSPHYPNFAPQIRHDGCINTACWMECPWRLSLTPGTTQISFSSNNAISVTSPSIETPTQLITSGDDRVVRFWDLRHSMGTTSPLECQATSLPFAHSEQEFIYDKCYPKHLLSGGVLPLYSLNTGHQGNIFHVEPLPSDAGKILTCAADGYLRLSDVVVSNSPSTVVLGPNNHGADHSASMFYSLRSTGMCFSFDLINSNVGLLCTERGLKKFDLRLSPRQQCHNNVLHQDRSVLCKACAIWKKPMAGDDDFYEEDVGSHYVFAGGAGADVCLYDLRMESSNSTFSRIVQKYRPRSFQSKGNPTTDERGRSSRSSGAVSVSGLDLSKDLRELLVSYENDQIYTFTIDPSAPPSGPKSSDSDIPDTLRQADMYEEFGVPASEIRIPIQTEKASYGAHLNRFTFLKSAKYAGPNDEYICTGSDSGHAWIYVRKTGEVASLLNADHSTCNGVVPHPVLPFFVTYGIDSTAKLWRATAPVGDNVDDSPLKRYDNYVHTPYEKSALVSCWKSVQAKLFDMEHPCSSSERCSSNSTDLFLLPDQVPPREEEVYEDSIFGAILPRRYDYANANSSSIVSRIRNDYTNLPTIVQQNYYTALKGKIDQELADDEDDESGSDEPIRSGLDALHKRVSLIRLYYQARRLGLIIPDEAFPWIMSARKRLLQEGEDCGYGHPADLIPDYSDWLLYDMEMTPKPKPFHLFEKEFFYIDRDEVDYDFDDDEDNNTDNEENITTADSIVNQGPNGEDIIPISGSDQDDKKYSPISTVEAQLDNQSINSSSPSSMPHSPNNATTYTPERAWEILTKTVLLLKEAGNIALRSNLFSLAATRYDKAIRYASIAYLPTCTPGNLSFLSSHIQTLIANSNHETSWTPLLKEFLSVRLNLSMTLLKPDLDDTKAAIEQASLALDALKPFCIVAGKAFSGKKLDVPCTIPSSIFQECKELQAKAYFRLGTAQNMSKDYASAISSLQKSIACSEDVGVTKPDVCVGRLLREAKQELAKRKKRHRKKFKSMFSS